MFHHLHDDKKYKKGQGSVSSKEFYKIIDFVGEKNILDAPEFINRLKERKLSSKNVCLTFDDGLKSQYDLASPILKSLNKKAFFFTPSEIFTNKNQKLEMYRYFRTNFFKNIEDFSKEFFAIVENSLKLNIDKAIKEKQLKIFGYPIKKWKEKFPYFSDNDIKFRIVRDSILSEKKYDLIMEKFLKKYKFKKKEVLSKIFFTKENVKKLHSYGHIIGLHSHSHPTMISNMSYKNQKIEYELNKKYLENITSHTIKAMSHPCGSYNFNSLKILKKLNIEIGFKQIMTRDKRMKKINQSHLEIARHDCPSILRIMNK
jgi:peptidoglycan/xylan/chitin deacetylase (PgdA/CDA1 family)